MKRRGLRRPPWIMAMIGALSVIALAPMLTLAPATAPMPMATTALAAPAEPVPMSALAPTATLAPATAPTPTAALAPTATLAPTTAPTPTAATALAAPAEPVPTATLAPTTALTPTAALATTTARTPMAAPTLMSALAPTTALAAPAGPVPIYQTLDELEGKTIAYLNGSVYDQKVEAKVSGTEKQFFPSLADCITAVETGKADAAVQLSFGLQLAVNRRGGTIALLPENVDEIYEGYFFPHGDPLVNPFNEVIARFEEDGTIEALTEKWVSADTNKAMPAQDWDAPNGTLTFATPGVLEPLSYVGEGGQALGYDVELALLVAKELGYHLDIQLIGMDAIVASVQAGKVDFGGTLTYTDERAEQVSFSDKVMPAYVSVVVKAQEGAGGQAATGGQSGTGAQSGADGSSSPELELNSFDELEGKLIGSSNGGTLDKLVDDALGTEHDYSYFNSVADMVSALQAGKIDAFLVDRPPALLAVSRNEGIGVMPGTVVEDTFGFFFTKGSPLKAEFDEVLRKYDEDGTLDELRDRWTGADESVKVLPPQDWATPKGMLTMTTSGIVGEPLVYIKNNQVVGYEIELAALICRELGYGLTVEEQEFSAGLAGVQTGKNDFGGGGISITPERQEKVDFSIPDYYGTPTFVVRTVGSDAAGGRFISSLRGSFSKTFIEENRWQLIVNGLGITALISVCSGALGLVLGYATVLARRKGIAWLTTLVSAYQAIMGGVPLVVVLMVLYYVVFGSFNISGTIVSIIAFTLAFGSAAGSTMWTAVAGIDTIQEEAGLALGYTKGQVFRKIIFPQAQQLFAPQVVGQFVSLVKDTAIVGYIAVQDLTRASDLIRARTMDAFFPLISTAVIYFLFCRVLAWALGRVAARLDVTNRPRKVEGVTETREVSA